jgi:hypothetical protein
VQQRATATVGIKDVCVKYLLHGVVPSLRLSRATCCLP